MTSSNKAPMAKKSKKIARPYNRYNIFFIVERENLILSLGGETKWAKAKANGEARTKMRPGFEDLNLPPFPPRFAHIDAPEDWCVPGGEKRRPHRRSHGVAGFRELARTIAANWKGIDDETLSWCTAVEKILKKRHVENNKREAEANALKLKSQAAEEAEQEKAKAAPKPKSKPARRASTTGIRTATPTPSRDVMLPVPNQAAIIEDALSWDAQDVGDFVWDPFKEETLDSSAAIAAAPGSGGGIAAPVPVSSGRIAGGTFAFSAAETYSVSSTDATDFCREVFFDPAMVPAANASMLANVEQPTCNPLVHHVHHPGHAYEPNQQHHQSLPIGTAFQGDSFVNSTDVYDAELTKDPASASASQPLFDAAVMSDEAIRDMWISEF